MTPVRGPDEARGPEPLFLIQKIHGKAFRLFPGVQIKEPEFEGCRSG